VLKNGLYNAAGGVVRIGIAILAIPILVRIIGIEEYGVWTLASSVISLATLAEGGLTVTTTFFLSKDIAQDDRVGVSETLTSTFVAILLFATLAASFLYFGSEFIISFFPKLKSEQYIQALTAFKLGSLVLWSRLLQQHLVGLIQSYERYGLLNILGTIQNTINTLGLIIIAAWGGRVIEMMEWQVLQGFGTLAAYYLFSNRIVKYAKPHFAWSRSKSIAIFKYSSVAWAGSIGSALFTQGDRLIVGSLLSVENLGIYAAITNIVGQINTLSALPISPLLPSITKLSTDINPDKSEINKKLRQSLQLNVLVAFSLGVLILAMSEKILTAILGGNVSTNAIYALRIATIIYTIYSLNAVGYYILYALGKVKMCTTINFLSAVLSLVMISVLSTRLGLVGAIIGNCGYIVTCLMTIISLNKLKIEMFLWFKWLVFPFVWFLVSMLFSLIFQELNDTVKIAIYSLEIFTIIGWFLRSNPINIANIV
jgi:O-antigen/teichoic acid export membrane protein